MAYTAGQLEQLWIQNGGNPASAQTAAAVALAESSGDPAATNHNSNGTIDRGLWQINSIHGAQSTNDVVANVRAAIAISNNGANWQPWTTYVSGAYQRFLASVPKLNTIGGPGSAGVNLSGVPGVSGVQAAAQAANNLNLPNPLSGIDAIAALLTSLDFWKRLGEVIAGLILVAMGLRSLTGGSVDPIEVATSAAAKVRPA